MARKHTSKKRRNQERKRAKMAAAREQFEQTELEEQPIYDEPVKVTDATFERLVLNSDVPVVVDFWASWCGPCRMLAPSLESLAKAKKGQVRICKYNTEQNSQYSNLLNVRSLPTLVLFQDGKVVDRLVGAVPHKRLESWVDGAVTPKRSLLGRLTGR